jgi:hypothetical protein
MNINEKTGVSGRFRLRVYRNGRLVETDDGGNLIVDNARTQLAHLAAGVSAGRHVTAIAFGTSGNQPQLSDTEIISPFTKEIDSVEYPSATQVQFNWTVAENEANGKAIMEFGLLCEDGTLFARYVRQTPLNKESDFSLEGDWTIEF